MIILLDCSYKPKDSNSRYFLEILEQNLNQDDLQECQIWNIKDVLIGTHMSDFVNCLREADALVLGVPLYVDGLPAQVVKLFEILLEHYQGALYDLGVYVVANLGFYESRQIRHMLDMVRNWCMRMGTRYGGGLAIGAGPMVRSVGPHKKLQKAFGDIANAVVEKESMGNVYCDPDIPRRIYMMAAHKSFKRTARKNNLDPKEI